MHGESGSLKPDIEPVTAGNMLKSVTGVETFNRRVDRVDYKRLCTDCLRCISCTVVRIEKQLRFEAFVRMVRAYGEHAE